MIGRVCGALLLLVACARSRTARDGGAPPPAREDRDSVFVEVVNDNYYDARVHLIYDGGTRHSLGTIGGNARQSIRAVPWFPRPLFVEVTLVLGGGVYRSQPIDVPQGEVLRIRVPADLETSGFFRRVRR
ncbi:MAG TPA: hypothetical protein VGJ80_05680 [Gemmatimonadales bacterium]